MTFESKWLGWEPGKISKTPGHETDRTDRRPVSVGFEGNSMSNATPGSVSPGLCEGRESSCIPTSVINVSSVTTRFRQPRPDTDAEEIHERWSERAAIAENDGGLSRVDAEILAWDEVKTCVVCLRETGGEDDAVRVSGGGGLHLLRCYDRYFGFRRHDHPMCIQV